PPNGRPRLTAAESATKADGGPHDDATLETWPCRDRPRRRCRRGRAGVVVLAAPASVWPARRGVRRRLVETCAHGRRADAGHAAAGGQVRRVVLVVPDRLGPPAPGRGGRPVFDQRRRGRGRASQPRQGGGRRPGGGELFRGRGPDEGWDRRS